MSFGIGRGTLAVMHRRHPLRLTLLALVTAFLALAGVATPADAAERIVDDPAGDVAYARGDITTARAIHGSDKVDLRVRTLQGGQPVNTWPNRASFIRWRIDSDATEPGPEYFADLRLARGADTVFVGRVRYADTLQLVPGCRADQHAPTSEALITAQQNLYRFQFLRGCVGAPTQFRARATFIWDNGAAGVGPVYTDYAPNGGPTAPIVSG